jgi:hypothetical protein
MTQLFSVIFSVVIVLDINFTLGFLQITYLTNGDELREGLAETEIHVFNMIYIFSPTVIANIKGLCPRFAAQLNSLE